MAQPVGPIPVQAPVPSILTTARDRSADGFGTSVPLPSDVAEALPEGVQPGRASWRGGIAWQGFGCQASYPWEDCPEDPEGSPMERSSYDGPVWSPVFHIYTPLECDWAGAESGLDAAARALTEAHTAHGVARALWMGQGLPVADHAEYGFPVTLRRSASIADGGTTAEDLDVVVARLLAEYETASGGLGGAVLHVPSIMMTGALGGLPGGGKIATPEGNVYRGPLGSLVSPGPGYPWGVSVEGPDGSGPIVSNGDGPTPNYAGNAADEVWVYVTGPVEYALTPVRLVTPDTADARRQNTAQVVAQRAGIFRFDPCATFAALAVNPYSAETS